MAEKVKVTLYDTEIEVERGTTLLELAKQYQCKEDNDIILAVVNGKLRELPRLINKPCEIKFLTIADKAGKKTYVRGLVLLMLKSLYEVVGEENIDKFLVEFALGTGYYCEVFAKVKLNQEIIDKVNWLKNYDNIVVKFGRFIPGHQKRFDEVLGVELASDNQHAEVIN